MWKLCENKISVPLNKVLLEDSIAHLGFFLWQLSPCNSRIEYQLCQRPCGPQSIKYLLFGPLQKKIYNA